MKKVLFILAITILVFPLLGIQKSYAESATIGFSPATGSFGKEFVVNLLVDGHGDKFNAAQATVHASSSLAIKDLVLGDCHFSFLKTPGTQDPSFAGVILSTYSTKCTVYTLTLVPVAKGNASLSLAEASVKRYGDAGNILSSTQNGSYTLTAALKAPALPGDQAKEKSQEGLYSVYLNVLSEKNTPVSNATVILTPVEGKTRKQATTNKEGAVHFTNLQAGIYDATIEENNTKVGERIINVSGSNHVLTLGINITGEQNNPLMKKANPILKIINPSPVLIVALVLGGIVLGTVMAVVFIRLRRRKKIPA